MSSQKLMFRTLHALRAVMRHEQLCEMHMTLANLMHALCRWNNLHASQQ